MKLVQTLLLFIFFFTSILAQDSGLKSKVKGIWYSETDEIPAFQWEAQWIWLQEKMDADVMLARRTFSLSEVPQKAQVRITASSQYQLFVNGEYVCRGPARSAPHHQSFDILDITSMLRTGKNTLAVRVHYQEGKRSYHHNGRAGLLTQLDIKSNVQELSIITDSNWKVSPALSWDNEAPNINRFQQVVCDRVDFRKHIQDWYKSDFDDVEWANAKPLMRKAGWPAPQKNARANALTPPWTQLVPRDVPYLIESEEPAINLIQAEQIDSETNIPFKSINISLQKDKSITKSIKNYLKGYKSLVISASEDAKAWFLLFDFGELINGMPMLDIEGAAGTKIEILCAPFVVDHQFTHKVVDSDFRDQIILSGERDSWEATYFKPTRYLGILIQNKREPVKIHGIGLRKLAYPFERKGHIHSSDAPWVAQYMKATAKTIQACTTDGYTDNYRERRQYAQTGYYAALGNYWIFGDISLQRRYLVQVAQEQQANGLMPAYAPLARDDFMVILDSNCLWIRSLRNYLLYSGDFETVKRLIPAARKLMELLHSYTNTIGLLDNPPYAYWMDHTQNDRRGANFCLNGHYLGALEDFAEILNWLNEVGQEKFHKRTYLLRKSLNTELWDEENGLFSDAWIDGKTSNQFSEHANAMALAMNVATPTQAESIAGILLQDDQHNFIKRESGITMVTPAMSYFFHKGLCNYGYVDESFDLFKAKFDKMLQPNTNGTLWEEWWLDGTGRSGTFQGGRTRSDAQTESAFPPALFAEYLLGVRVIKPGFKEVEIIRSPSKLKHIEGEIPSPEGMLLVRWIFDTNGGGELKVTVPGKMHVKIDLENLNISEEKQLFVNGKAIDIAQSDDSYYELSKGSYTISF
ncbi:MAG: hypothetical protein GY702_19610 [Desulfobulbaceae bacterium]|nr:hypothetical protein [Desulfobulbaceae bacterium]